MKSPTEGLEVKHTLLNTTIVASLLGLAPVSGFATELIYTNAKIYTVDADQPWAQAVAIEDGKFTAVGSAEEITALAEDGTEVIDLGGRVVLPGLIDDHIHVDMVAENTMNVMFDPLQDYDAFKETIAELLERRPDAP